MLSYEEVGPAAMLSRAQMGIHARRIVVSLPGSPNACRLALEKLLLPELGHLVREVESLIGRGRYTAVRAAHQGGRVCLARVVACFSRSSSALELSVPLAVGAGARGRSTGGKTPR